MYCLVVGRTEPNLDDLGLTFQDLNVNIEELSDYVRNVDPLPFVTEVPKFPVPRESLLNFPKPNSRELLEREEHVHEHLPPMHPDWDGRIPILLLYFAVMNCIIVLYLGYTYRIGVYLYTFTTGKNFLM